MSDTTLSASHSPAPPESEFAPLAAEEAALIGAIRRGPGPRSRTHAGDHVRAAARRYAARARAIGLPPGCLLVRLRRRADDAARGVWPPREALSDRVVRWAIEGYYAVDDHPGTDSAH